MRRSRMGTAAMILLTGLLLGGCGEQPAKSDADIATKNSSSCAIEVMKDGSIMETITEEFSEEYYDEESLKTMILSEVADFNRSHANDTISVDKLENKNGKITVKIRYPSADIYTEYNTDDYNAKTLFNGTVAEAYDAGYSLDISMTDVKGENTIDKDELLGMGSEKIIISEAPLQIKVPGKILYVGEKVEADSKDEAHMLTDANGEAAGKYYVIYK